MFDDESSQPGDRLHNNYLPQLVVAINRENRHPLQSLTLRVSIQLCLMYLLSRFSNIP